MAIIFSHSEESSFPILFVLPQPLLPSHTLYLHSSLNQPVIRVHLTNRRQFYTIFQKMFKTQWFHCQILNILWRHFMVYKSIDPKKLPSICFFYNNMENVRAELAIFFVEKACMLHLTSLLLSVLL